MGVQAVVTEKIQLLIMLLTLLQGFKFLYLTKKLGTALKLSKEMVAK
jgi:hypothetical protein